MKTHLLGEGGAGTVTSLALLAAFSFFLIASFRLGAFTLEQQRLEAATETIALAVSDVSRGYRTGYPCEVARHLAALNEVVLLDCHIAGFDAFVTAQSRKVKPALTTSARAGS